jgi:hypothetical protein
MDWFERLTGFREKSYNATKSLLHLDGEHLRSDVNSQRYCIGHLEMPTLGELRSRVAGLPNDGALQFHVIRGDARTLHRASENCGSFFQVASQFNLLEMVGPEVTPEDGVTRYEWDRTQGPACAIAAGAATLYRNYFVPLAEQRGQTSDCQLDALADVRDLLATRIGMPADQLWTMKNGYPVASQRSVETVRNWLQAAAEADVDQLRASLRIGVHWDVEVADDPEVSGGLVNQAFCSAIPVSYSRVAAVLWEPLARLVLEAAYEAALSAAVLNSARGRSNTLYLTKIGGGAFGNPGTWIDAALKRSLRLFADYPLQVMLVEYGRH